jgi:hypothetical protein
MWRGWCGDQCLGKLKTACSKGKSAEFGSRVYIFSKMCCDIFISTGVEKAYSVDEEYVQISEICPKRTNTWLDKPLVGVNVTLYVQVTVFL